MNKFYTVYPQPFGLKKSCVYIELELLKYRYKHFRRPDQQQRYLWYYVPYMIGLSGIVPVGGGGRNSYEYFLHYGYLPYISHGYGIPHIITDTIPCGIPWDPSGIRVLWTVVPSVRGRVGGCYATPRGHHPN